MKLLFALLFVFPIAGFSQKVKVNEYDKFIKQRRIELEPLTILSSTKSKVSLSFNSTASTFYVQLSGYGWGASTIDANQEVIFLFSNDSTVTVKSTSMQTYDPGSIYNSYNSYSHQYFITLADIEALSRNELVGIRKYSLKDFSDLKVSGEYTARIKRLSSLFLEELKKAKILHTLKRINVKDIGQFIGDSVLFCSKVFNTRYFESSADKPALLDLNETFSSQPLNAVVWEQDRKNFSNAPELLYKNKEVCISGVVVLQNNLPQITLHRREQITVKTPINLEEVPLFIGDSVMVRGKVAGGRYYSVGVNSPTVLNMGAPYPDQLLTIVIENKDRKNFIDKPEEFYVDKEVSVLGRIVLENGQPQMVIRNKDQIAVIKTSNTATATQASLNSSGGYTAQASKNESITRSAEFPGGEEGFASFLRKNLKVPQELDAGQKATVVARFVIDTSGNVSNLEIRKSAGTLFDKEVIRVLKTMPKWTPRLLNGFPLKEMFERAVTFNFVDFENKSGN
jgi:TonB family protein